MASHLDGESSFGHYLVNTDDQAKLFAFDIDLVKDVNPDAGDHGKYPEFSDPAGKLKPGSPREVFQSNDDVLVPWMISELRGVADGLAARAARMYDVRTAIAFSGSKGLHVYCFTGLTDAADVKAAGMDVVMSTGVFEPRRGNNFFRHTYQYPNVEIEVFPKQDSLEGKDLGNLMRLPLGRHAKSGRDCFFLDPFARNDVLVAADPVDAMEKGVRWNVSV